MNPNQMQIPNQPMPVISGTKFIYFNKSEVEWMKLDCQQAAKALDKIDEVSDLAIPLNTEISKWAYDTDYVKSTLLSNSVSDFRQLLLDPSVNLYLKSIYKLQISDDSETLTKEQKQGLKDMDLRFDPSQPYTSDEVGYINNLVTQYIETVEPILFEVEQSMIVKLNTQEKPERVPMSKRIFLF